MAGTLSLRYKLSICQCGVRTGQSRDRYVIRSLIISWIWLQYWPAKSLRINISISRNCVSCVSFFFVFCSRPFWRAYRVLLHMHRTIYEDTHEKERWDGNVEKGKFPHPSPTCSWFALKETSDLPPLSLFFLPFYYASVTQAIELLGVKSGREISLQRYHIWFSSGKFEERWFHVVDI